MNEARFRDRSEAGRRLASALNHYAGRSDLLLLGLARGGVPVAYEVATALHAPLDVMLVRKLGVPGHEEFAMGAVASGGIRVITRDVVAALGISDATLEIIISEEEQELRRREQAFGATVPHPRSRAKR